MENDVNNIKKSLLAIIENNRLMNKIVKDFTEQIKRNDEACNILKKILCDKINNIIMDWNRINEFIDLQSWGIDISSNGEKILVVASKWTYLTKTSDDEACFISETHLLDFLEKEFECDFDVKIKHKNNIA